MQAIRPITWKRAEKLLGCRIDRRRRYAFDPQPDLVKHNVLVLIKWTAGCSGCNGDDDYGDLGSGCSECGHTGRRRRAMWVPWCPSVKMND